MPLLGLGGVPAGGASAVTLNVDAGTVVSNLVMVELGLGAVTIESNAARVHLVADVVGCVTG